MNIVLCGKDGNMGKIIEKIIKERDGISVCGYIGKDGITSKGKIDAILDFSSLEGLKKALRFALDEKVPFVSGTTGLGREERELLLKASCVIPVFYSSNFSKGITLIEMFLKENKGFILENYDTAIEDIHRRNKKDAPSGTALKLKNCLDDKAETVSLRMGDVFGRHRIILEGEEEEIEINHRALSRKLFAEGALDALKFIRGKEAGLYDMSCIIKENTYER